MTEHLDSPATPSAESTEPIVPAMSRRRLLLTSGATGIAGAAIGAAAGVLSAKAGCAVSGDGCVEEVTMPAASCFLLQPASKKAAIVAANRVLLIDIGDVPEHSGERGF